MNKKLVFILINITLPISSLAMDIYTPSMPQLASYFGVSTTTIKLTVSFFFIGFFVGEFFLGTLADSIGRRKIILIGLFFTAVFSILPIFTAGISLFILCKILQGAFSTAPATLAKAVITDIYTKEEMPKAMSILSISWVAPLVFGPYLGGYLQVMFGWRASFIVITVYSVVVFILLAAYLPETLKEKRKVNLFRIINDYKSIIVHKSFLACSIILGVTFTIMMVFYVAGPFIIQDALNYSAFEYGQFVLSIGIFCLAGVIIHILLIHRINHIKLLIAGIIGSVLITIIMYLLSSLMHQEILLILLPMFGLVFFGRFIYPSTISFCLKIFPEKGGTAVALSGAIMKIFCAAATAIISIVGVSTISGLALTYVIMFVIVVACFFIIFYSSKKAKNNKMLS